MCTIGQVQENDGKVLLFSTSDNPFTIRNRLLATSTPKRRCIATQISCSEPDVPWHDMYSRGLNSSGLAYTWASVATSEDMPVEGMSYVEAGKGVLEDCSSIDTALSFLTSRDRLFAGNFYLADSSGLVVYLELGYRHFESVRLNGQRYHAATNHFQLDSMKSLSSETPITIGRLNNALSFLSSAECTPQDLQELLASTDPMQPAFSVCSGIEPGATAGSISAEILDPANKTLFFCFGWAAASAPRSNTPMASSSWASFRAFPLDACPDGELVDHSGNILV